MDAQPFTLRKLRAFASLLGAAPTPRRILVVDDDDMICSFVARALRHAGYLVETATSAREALETLESGAAFDVVVTDVRMPAMSGPRFIDRWRESEPDVKVLYLTGYQRQLFAERGTLLNDEAVLEKPCTVHSLLGSVASLLRGGFAPPAASH